MSWDLAESEVVEEVDPFDVGAERDGVLEVDDDAVLTLAVDPLDVVGGKDESDFAAEHVDHRARLGDAFDGGLESDLDAISGDVGTRPDRHAGRFPQADVVLDGLGVGLYLAGGHAGHEVAGYPPVNAPLMKLGESGAHVVVEEEAGRGGGLLRVDDEGLVVQLTGLGGRERRWTDGVSDGWHGNLWMLKCCLMIPKRTAAYRLAVSTRQCHDSLPPPSKRAPSVPVARSSTIPEDQKNKPTPVIL